jgi:hypothetical protein
VIASRLIFALSLTVVFAFAPVESQSEARQLLWDLKPVRCGVPAKALTLNEQLICFHEDLQKLDVALAAGYRQKVRQLNDAQIDALRIDHRLWFLETCVGDRSGAHPPSAATAHTCLLNELPKRREFVASLPVDQPDVPYRLSRFERVLLKRYAGNGIGILNGMQAGVSDDAVRSGLRRVFSAVLPTSTDSHFDGKSSPTSQFIGAAFGDSAFKLENDRYFVDFGAKPHDGSLEGMFVVDMESGEIALAIIEAQTPALSMWEKSCISPELRSFSRARFRAVAQRAAIDFHLDGVSKSELAEYVGTTPCR